MKNEVINGYVRIADDDDVVVYSMDDSLSNELKSLGFKEISLDEYSMHVNDDDEKAKIFSRLQELEVCFSAGREWCPSEVFEYLRDAGLVNGLYRRISWSSPNEYNVTED